MKYFNKKVNKMLLMNLIFLICYT